MSQISTSEPVRPRDSSNNLLTWAPSIANGAALIAITGMVGDLSDANFALRALSVPLGLFGLGLLSGLLSTAFASRQESFERQRQGEHLNYELARQRELEAKPRPNEQIPELELLKIIIPTPGGAEEYVKSTYAILLERQASVQTWADKLRTTSINNIEALNVKINRWSSWSTACSTASTIFAASAFVFILAAQPFGWTLQPQKLPEPAATITVVAAIHTETKPLPTVQPTATSAPTTPINRRPSSAPQ